jgi:hypothetical protein
VPLVVALVPLVTLLGACDPDAPEPTPGPGIDAALTAPDARVDASPSTDAAPDAAPDASADAAPDASADASADAGFAQLSVVREGDGEGRVTAAGTALDCGDSCSVAFDLGQSVVLVATPAPGSTFTGWSGACSGIADCALTLAGETSVTATFVTTRVPVGVTVYGPGGGRVVDDQGHFCLGTCVTDVVPGTHLTLGAEVLDGPFQGWTGDCSGKGACELVVDTVKAVRAVFGHLAFVVAQPWGGGQSDYVEALRAGPDGDVYVAGHFEGSTPLGAFTLDSRGGADGFVARLDGATGAPRWVRTFGGTGSDLAQGLAIRDGHLYVPFDFEDTVDFGTGPLSVSTSSVALVELDSAGDTLAVHTLRAEAGAGTLHVRDVAVAADGRVFLAGSFSGTIDFGARTVTGENAPGLTDAWLLELAADGTPGWLRTAHGTLDDTSFQTLAVTPADQVVVGGKFGGTIDLGGGPRSANPGPAGIDQRGFVAVYDGTDGAHRWSRALESTGPNDVTRVASDEAGDVYLSGFMSDDIELGGGVVVFSNSSYVAKLAGATGDALWALDEQGGKMADVSGGNVLLSGGFTRVQLAVLDTTTGTTLSERFLEHLAEGGPEGVLVGDHAWVSLRVFFLGAFVDGLDVSAGPGNTPEWLVRLGL